MDIANSSTYTKKHYVTAAGLETLQSQLMSLRQERHEVAEELIEIASQSTPSSTFEDSTFAQNHSRATDLDARIAGLEQVIRTAEILKAPSTTDRVQVGSKVTVELDGKQQRFSIVSPLEADPLNGKVSDVSPFGLSIIGRKLHELVQIVRPGNRSTTALILRIE